MFKTLFKIFFAIILAVSCLSVFSNKTSKPEKISSLINMDITQYTLPNGLTVILNPDDNFSLFSYELRFAVGSRHERLGNTGISHMFEHLMFEGTKKYPGSAFSYFQKNGAINVNATTYFDRTNYFATFPPEKLDFILGFEADRMMNLILNKERLEAERGAVQEEKKRSYGNNPIAESVQIFYATLFTKHPYRQPVIGYDEDIKNYTLEDLKGWHKTYYSPNNAILVLSGNFKVSEAKKLIEKYFGPWQKQEIKQEKIIQEPPQKKFVYKKIKKPVQNSTVRVGFKIQVENLKERVALDILASILGSGQSSRIYKKLVRESKLASQSYAYNQSLVQQDIFVIGFQPFGKPQEIKAKKLIEKELKKLRTELIDSYELEAIKNKKMTAVVQGLKFTGSRTSVLSEYQMIYGDYKMAYEELDQVELITPEFLRSVAQKHFNPHQMTYFVLEPLK